MKKEFILLTGLIAILAVSLNVKAQEVTNALTSMNGIVVRSQSSFITNGNWNDGSNWNTGEVPAPGSDVVIMANVVIPAGYTAVANEVIMQGGSITVADGGQLRHNTDGLVVTMKKNIEPYNVANGTDNYYLLSFPFSEDVAVTNAMTATQGCDFYKFDGNYPNAEWRNNRKQAILNVGGATGYLYANPEAIEISLAGHTYPSYNEETKTVTITYTENSTNLSNGWALLGNPFTCNAYIYCYNSNDELVPMDFMVYDANGDWVTLSSGPIAPMQGFFVKVTETTTVYIKNYAAPVAHEYVDLGLPSGTLWATCNVGADAPEDFGDYFAWGETQPKDYYDWSTYQYCMGSENSLTKYCTDSAYGYNGFTDYLTTLLPEDDAATANWGEDWRMPTHIQWQELYLFTTQTWTTLNGVQGCLFTASNGNSLFLPSAGFRYDDEFYYTSDNWGFYWSSVLHWSITEDARIFCIGSGSCAMSYYFRDYGSSVRAVRTLPNFDPPVGTINGMFSVNEDGDQVYFSQGNLQYIGSAATPYWRFAENQWDFLGTSTGQNSSNQNVDRDLFGWGTSGYDHGANCYQPWSTSQTSNDYYAYGSSDYDLNDSTGMADWGCNPIINGGNEPNQWRTLTGNEWEYIFNYRATATGIRYAKADVNGVSGVILLPDDWDDYYPLSNANDYNASYSSNVITDIEWGIFEENGAVFLPAAGYRKGTSLSFVGDRGWYWSGSHYDYNDQASHVFFYNSYMSFWGSSYRYYGQSVRLVCPPSPNISYIVNATANSTEGGSVSGGGTYQYGSDCTLTATANDGYVFVNWTWNGRVVSTDATYTFTVKGNRDIVANFGLYSVGSCIDLGLPSGLLWATCNVGAVTPEGYGDYFAWGETQPKDNYSWSTYQHCNVSNNRLTKYCVNPELGYNGFTDYLTTLLPEDDAAAVNWGEDWRMPTKNEWQELYDNTTQTQITQNGIIGMLFTASNGNTLFMPFADSRYGSDIYETSENGYYWSSSLDAGNSDYALDIVFDMWSVYGIMDDGGNRCIGMPVRAVHCKNSVINVTPNSTSCGSVSGGGTFLDGANCTVTATPNDGYTFICWSENNVTVSPEATYSFVVSGDRNLVAYFYNNISGAYQYVDLGLPSGLQWATCNVGAETPEGYGDYFAWGETQPKSYYSWSTYQYGYDIYWLTKYCADPSLGYNGFTDHLIVLLPEDDAATVNWGEDWRMPTKEEWQELYENAIYTWTTLNGVKGSIFTVSNGNSLFLPAAGSRFDYGCYVVGTVGSYWSSSLYTDYSNYAWCFNHSPGNCNISGIERDGGHSVRAVHSSTVNTPFVISATANPIEGGEAIGGGDYQEGTICTLAAMANYGYTFVNWTENGEVISTDDIYSFTVTGDRSFVANYTTNDHGYVDLGLPSGILWATCNVGADNPEDYGDYFAWGETTPKDTYNWSTYQYCMGSSNTFTKYCSNSIYGYNGFTDNLTTLLPEDDAAVANWGADWRMPTNEEWQELYDNTTHSVTIQNGVRGWLFTAASGSSLFLPYAGYHYGNSFNYLGSAAYYWSSSLYTDAPTAAWLLCSDNNSLFHGFRYIGQSVRAVRSNNPPTGAINGKFTINADGGQVYFSQGNLQYIGSASTPYWKFADNQWDFLGSAQNGSSPSKDRDLFCWGTSGYDHGAICYQPWSTSTRNSDYYAYGSSSYNLCDQTRKADWGYNAISNGGNLENSGWRTLTRAEWEYVFNTRSTTSGIRFAKANVNSVNGVIILPDDWNTDYYSLNSTNTGGANYSSNTITAEQWTTLEQYGAVFLPAAFYSDGGYVYTTDSIGYYWSASRGASRVSFSYMSLSTGGTSACSTGRSVRLVRDIE